MFRFLITNDILPTLTSFNNPKIGKIYEELTALKGIDERTSRMNLYSKIYFKAIFLGSKISSPETLEM
jgi:hypothetical protein